MSVVVEADDPRLPFRSETETTNGAIESNEAKVDEFDVDQDEDGDDYLDNDVDNNNDDDDVDDDPLRDRVTSNASTMHPADCHLPVSYPCPNRQCWVAIFVLFGIFIVLLLLLGIVLVRAFTFYPARVHEMVFHDAESTGGVAGLKNGKLYVPSVNASHLDRLRQALRIPTVSFAPRSGSPHQLAKFHELLEKSFPRIHKSPIVVKETIANYSLLYRVKGSDEELEPYLLCAHMDVVPAEVDGGGNENSSNKNKWKYAKPFSADLKDGFIHARGTLDDKAQLMAIMEALEDKLARGDFPQRTLYLAFGHDEEVYGLEGAKSIADTFQRRGLTFKFILDEGGIIVKNFMPGLPGDVEMAMISVQEKGWLTLKLRATGSPGHGSMPKPNRFSAIAKIANAISKLETRKFPNEFGNGLERVSFEYMAPYLPTGQKILFANLWIFAPIVVHQLEKSSSPVLNAIVRTTTATTIIRGGSKWNVLSEEAEAIVQHRLHPRQTIRGVIDRDVDLIDDESVSIERLEPEAEVEASPIADYEGDDAFGWHTIKNTIHRIFPKALAIPYMMVANTDTRYYHDFSDNIYRFQPVALKWNDLNGIHGYDERISVVNYARMIQFYSRLMKNSDLDALEPL